MGSHFWPSIMKTSFIIFFSVFLLPVFTQRTSCTSDGDCGKLQRSQCMGINFIFCFGRMEKISVRGKCVQKKCAKCLKNADCGGSEICSGYSCAALSDYI